MNDSIKKQLEKLWCEDCENEEIEKIISDLIDLHASNAVNEPCKDN